MSESSIQRDIRVGLSNSRRPFFRNNVGTGWTGSKIVRHNDGSITIYNARPLHAGLCTGSSDLIGMTPYVVQPEDVGRTIAVFTALEVKTAKGAIRKEQAPFLRMVNANGGLGAIVRSAEDAEAVTTEMWKCELVRKYSEI